MSHVSDPAGYAEAVTPDDSTVFSTPTRCLHIGTAGNLTVRMWRGQNTVLFPSVPVGVFPVEVDKVFAAGTAASGIVRLW